MPRDNERDPLEQFDMAQELEQIRTILRSRGFRLAESSPVGDVWGDQRGFRVFVLHDPNGRIRLEARNFQGFTVVDISPAWPAEVERQLP